MVETYQETPESKKPQRTGATVVPGGIEFPRPSELGSSRDSIGRLGTGPDKWGGIRIVPSGRKEPGPSAEEVIEHPLPMRTQLETPDMPAPPEKRKSPMPQQRTE